MEPQALIDIDNDGDRSSNDTMMESQPRHPLDRLHISLPQVPPRLPAPPTFAMNALNVHASNQKHVQFRDARVVSFIKPGSSMSIEERNELWYPTSDLDGFKVEARTLCRKLREPPVPLPTTAAAEATATVAMGMEAPCTMSMQEKWLSKGKRLPLPPTPHHSCPYAGELIISEHNYDNDDDSDEQLQDDGQNGETRGLEHRVCINRQRHKHLAIRCTLKAQSRSRCPEFIARISSQCSQWARDLAIKEANRDYCEAYCPHKLSPKVLTNESPFPVPIRQTTKRCYDGEGPSCPTMRLEVQQPPIAELAAVEERISTASFSCPNQRQREMQEAMSCMERCVRRRQDAKLEK